MTTSSPSLGKLLKQWRDRAGLTQDDAAEKAGIERTQSLSAYENDDPKRKPPKVHLVALAQVYALSFVEKNELLITAGFSPEIESAVDERRKVQLREMLTRFPLVSREEQLAIAGIVRGASVDLRFLGGLEDAHYFLTQALILHRTLGRTKDEAHTLYDLAHVYRELGDGRQAVLLWKRAKNIYTRLAEEGWERQVLQLHMEIARGLAADKRHAARCVAIAERCNAALTKAEEMEGREYRWVILGEIHQLAGRLEVAEAYTRRAYEASLVANNGSWYASNLVRMGEILYAMHKDDDAQAMLERARYMYYKLGSPARAKRVEAMMSSQKRGQTPR